MMALQSVILRQRTSLVVTNSRAAAWLGAQEEMQVKNARFACEQACGFCEVEARR
jgi:hypothetical protein